MRFNKLDINQLVVLDALLTERSVSRAAERLLLSQPATSCSLGRLRDYFEDELLVQVGRTMVLTPLADSLVKPLRDVLLRIEAFTTIRADFDPATIKRELKVEVSDYMIEVVLAEVLGRCAAQAPQLEFDIRMINKHSADHLALGEIDLLIGPDFLCAADHPSKALLRESFSCVVWEGNSQVGEVLEEAQFFELGHVVTEWSGQLSFEDRFLASRGTPRRREVVVPGYALISDFLVGSRRIATLQTRLAERLRRSAPLRVLPCPVKMAPVFEKVQWHRYHERDPVIGWLESMMQDVIRTMA